MKKKGATDWTVGKLMTIILAIVLLALIIYGISTGGINPLKERIVGMWDNVLGMLPWGDGGDGEAYCERRFVEDIGWGNFCIGKKECKIQFEEKIVIGIDHISKNSVSYDEETDFAFLNGNLMRWEVGEVSGWVLIQDNFLQDFVFSENIEISIKERKIYQDFASQISEQELLFASGDLGRSGGRMNFRVDDWGEDTSYERKFEGWYYWPDGTGGHKQSWTDEEALKQIKDNAGWIHTIYWWSSNDLESEVNSADLEKVFYAKLKEFEEEAKEKRKEPLEKLKNMKISIYGEEFELQVDESGNLPVFFVEGSFGKYGLFRDTGFLGGARNLAKFSSNKWVPVDTPRSFLLSSERESDETGQGELGYSTEDLIKLAKIYKFLMDKCGR